MMTTVSEVPIVEVHAGNIVELWPSLIHAVRTSSFIAIDTVSSVITVNFFYEFLLLMTLLMCYYM